MKSDIEIAREANMQPIQTVAEKLDITADELDLYGKYKAKLTDELWERIKDRPDGKLVLVTAINPTPAGEGKTTTTVGLGQAMDKIGKKAIIALREPSLGPVSYTHLSALAAKYSIMIGFGYITMLDEFGRNHFCFVDENGSVLADYEKIHPFTHGGETKAYRGGGEICHISMDEMRLGMAVCYDLRFPEMFQQMPLDTNVIFLIANWPESRIKQWYSLLTARAIEMSSYVVGVNRTGEGDGIQYTKSSAAYAPDGSMISPDSKKWNDYVTLDFSEEDRKSVV